MGLDDLHNDLEQELHDQWSAFSAYDRAAGLHDKSHRPEEGLDLGSTVNPQKSEDILETIELEAVRGTLNNFHTPGMPLSAQDQKFLAEAALKQMDSTETIELMDGNHSNLICVSSETNTPNNFVYEDGTFEAYPSRDGSYMTMDDASEFAGNILNSMFSGNRQVA